jgi:Mce-associated membrane protein
VTEPVLDDEGIPAAPPEAAHVESHELPLEAAVGEDPPSHGGEPDDLAPGPGRRSRAWMAAAGVLAVAVIGLSLVAATLASSSSAERGDRRQVEDVSGRFATALLTYDYQDLKTAKARVLALSTGKFKAEYEQAFTGGLDKLFTETQARSAGTVEQIFVGDIEDDSVTTVVVVNAVAKGSAGSRRLISSYIQLQLVKVKGRWRVDGVTNLNLGAPSTDSPALPTTTTTAPAK